MKFTFVLSLFLAASQAINMKDSAEPDFAEQTAEVMSITEETSESPSYGLFINKQGHSVCAAQKVRGPACGTVLNGDVIKQKSRVQRLTKKRVCTKGVCSLPEKHKKPTEKKDGSYTATSPRPFKHVISAVYGKADVTDLVQQLYYEGFNSFYATNDIWGENWAPWRKSFSVTYRNGGQIFRSVIGEGDNREI